VQDFFAGIETGCADHQVKNGMKVSLINTFTLSEHLALHLI